MLLLMINLPRIDHLQWDEWNREHISKHGVSPDEVQAVIAGEPLARETYKARIQVIGPTGRERMLSIVVGIDPNQAGVYYVFSARPASRKERRAFEQQKKDEAP